MKGFFFNEIRKNTQENTCLSREGRPKVREDVNITDTNE